MSIEFPSKFNILTDVPLSEHTKIKVGGKADYFVLLSSQDELAALYRFCRKQGVRFLVLGHGSNVFFPDKGFRGLIAVVQFNKIKLFSENIILAEAGASLAAVNQICINNSLTGFEFSSGIPGTIGGAIYGNAGAYGKAIGDCLNRAKILTSDSNVKWVDPDYFGFAYRYSKLKLNDSIVLAAEFQFQSGDIKKIRSKVNEILELRRKKLPAEDYPTAGSYFKNIKDVQGNATAAAIFLDAIGSKQIKVGDAAVYHRHANIFINSGNATSSDILKLEKILRQKVYERFGIELEREVVYIE